MHAISSALNTHQSGEVTTLATLAKLTRRDGVVLAVTLDHDKPIIFESVTYLPTAGLSPSTIQTSAILNVDNMDAKGALLSIGVTEASIISGVWDLCDVRVMRVNWADLTQGAQKLKRGNFGEVSIGRGTFSVEVRGITQRLQTTIGDVVTPACNANLFDSRCGIAELEGTWKFSNIEVASVLSNQRQFTAVHLTQESGTTVAVTDEPVTFVNGSTVYLKHADVFGVVISPALVPGIDYIRSDRAGAIIIPSTSPAIVAGTPVSGTVSYSYAKGGFFEGGKLLWTSGLNAGLSKEVKTFMQGGNVTLQEPMPYAISSGDIFTIWTGCLKRAKEDCKTKFDNLLRFRGFKDLPGQDEMFKGLSSAAEVQTIVGSTGTIKTTAVPVNAEQHPEAPKVQSAIISGEVTGYVIGPFTDTSGNTGTLKALSVYNGDGTSTLNGAIFGPVSGTVSGTLRKMTAAEIGTYLTLISLKDISGYSFSPIALPPDTNYTNPAVIDGFNFNIVVDYIYTNRTSTAPQLTFTVNTGIPPGIAFSAYSPTLGLTVGIAALGGTVQGDVMIKPDGGSWTVLSGIDNRWKAGIQWLPASNLFVYYCLPLVPGGVSFLGTITWWNTMTSPDGVTWTQLANSPDAGWEKYAYSSSLGYGIALGSGYNIVVGRTTNQLNWVITDIPNTSGNTVGDLIWCPTLNIFVAVSDHGGSNAILTSTNGLDWIKRKTPGGRWSSIAWSPTLNLFAVAGRAFGTSDTERLFNSIMTSPDAVTWTVVSPLITPRDLSNMQWLNNMFIATGNNISSLSSTAIFTITSTDAVTWVDQGGGIGYLELHGGVYKGLGGSSNLVPGAPVTTYWLQESYSYVPTPI